MAKDRLLIYGANGYVGEAASRLAVEQGLNPVLAGRNGAKIDSLAAELGVEARAFELDDVAAIDSALRDARVVLHLAGPYLHTFKSMVDACLRTGTHYLDITGELPVLQALAARDAEARERGVMVMPAVGLDSVPSDCLAAHLLRRLPGASHLTLGLQVDGPAGLPPGTQRTMIELAPRPDRVIKNGSMREADARVVTRTIDFGKGPVTAVRFQAPDPYVVFHTTGIENIEMYVAMPMLLRVGYRLFRYLRPVFRSDAVRSFLKLLVLPGPSARAREQTVTHVWAEARDDEGRTAASRLHGPEGALVWTTRTALTVARKVLEGRAPHGFQTPAGAYGPDLVLESEGVVREDVR
ncbi:MAG TPA: saccharopine dehydrogenase NADP-binding domain-containing protein [Trueperaceae bacterium]|nr:saccharopine dehydrogenase NADP-binding domain-containing protein [Trueperaceae bacterium]